MDNKHEHETTEEREQTAEASAIAPRTDARRRYEAPKLTKKRSVARVTLFSGGGATAGGLTAAG